MLNYADSYRKGSPDQISISYEFRWHINDADNKTYRKITTNPKFTSALTIDRYKNADIVMVFKDSDCKKNN